MISSQDHRVVPVPARGLLSGQRVGVPHGGVPAGPALLTVSEPSGSRTVAVRVTPLAQVPAGVLAVGEDLADGLALRAGTQWSLNPSPATDARRMVLELSTERNPDQVAREIAGAGLEGTLLWLPPVADGDLWLDIADVPYRVLEIDTGGPRGVVARVAARTVVELFAPGVKAGVDIVILADCSGSMDVEDIPVPAESRFSLRRRATHIRRMEALQQALRDLLEVRLRVGGRVSRMAMLEFNTKTTARFPRDGGMAQLDGGSPPEVIAQFREAVSLLRANGGTSIGNALHAAADLIYQHGHPANDRLVVLVSDGADWTPKGDQGIGEIMNAVTEPVSLMDHLHRDMSIRLHAIGISTRELYLRRYPHRDGLTPDHKLLEELVRVGGGDPTTIGGLDVLVEYFSGVGSGVTHRVAGPLSERRPADLDHEAARLLAAAGANHATADTVGAEVEALGAANARVEFVAQRVFPGPLFNRFAFGRASGLLRREVSGEPVAATLRKALKMLVPVLPEQSRPPQVRRWATMVDGLVGLVSASPPDLAGLAALCRADGTGSAELISAVIRRLTLGLTEIADEAERLPDYVDTVPATTMPVGAPDGGGRGPVTQPATALPDALQPEMGGFVYKE